MEELAGSDIRDAVEQRAELLERRTRFKERCQGSRSCELDELVLGEGERVDAIEERIVRRLRSQSAQKCSPQSMYSREQG